MREQIEGALKQASEAQYRRQKSTLRLIKATIKDRDNAAKRTGGEAVSDDDILAILVKMIRQRIDSAKHYEREGRHEMVLEELEEIDIIKAFLPKQLEDSEIHNVCAEAIKQTDSHSLRDLGKCMQALKESYPGQMDYGKAIKGVKQQLQ